MCLSGLKRDVDRAYQKVELKLSLKPLRLSNYLDLILLLRRDSKDEIS